MLGIVDHTAIAVSTFFPALNTGGHTLSLWLRGVGVGSCWLNTGNYPMTAFIEEIPQ